MSRDESKCDEDLEIKLKQSTGSIPLSNSRLKNISTSKLVKGTGSFGDKQSSSKSLSNQRSNMLKISSSLSLKRLSKKVSNQD